MSNLYLEKVASLYDFWNDFSGKEHADLKARKHHLEKALANNDTLESLSGRIKNTGEKTFRARSRVAFGAAGLAALGIAGSKVYSDYQNRVAERNLRELYSLQKRASAAGAFAGLKSAGNTAIKKTVDGTKYVGNKTLDVLNTTHGGKVKEFGVSTFGKNSPNFKKFIKADRKEQLKLVSGPNLDKLKKLHSQQRRAQIGVYGSAGALTLAYRSRKNNQPAYQSPYYY